MAVVVKLMIGVSPLMAKSYDSMLPKSHILRTPVSSCFEIYGFDVMIDQDLKVRIGRPCTGAESVEVVAVTEVGLVRLLPTVVLRVAQLCGDCCALRGG